MDTAFERLIGLFKDSSHRLLKFSKDADALFLSYAAYFNIRVKLCRDAGKIHDGARAGACPWRLGMLSAALTLWDLAWEQSAEKPDASPITIDVNVVERAFGLLEILESIPALLAGEESSAVFSEHVVRERPVGPTDEEALAARMTRNRKPDFSFPERAQQSDLKDSDFARRLLLRAKPVQGCVNQFQTPARMVCQIVNAKDAREMTAKPTLADARRIMGAIPEALGKFDEENDVLGVTVPPQGSATEPWSKALAEYANITADDLRHHLDTRAACPSKHGTAGREAHMAAKRPRIDGAGAEEETAGGPATQGPAIGDTVP